MYICMYVCTYIECWWCLGLWFVYLLSLLHVFSYLRNIHMYKLLLSLASAFPSSSILWPANVNLDRLLYICPLLIYPLKFAFLLLSCPCSKPLYLITGRQATGTRFKLYIKNPVNRGFLPPRPFTPTSPFVLFSSRSSKSCPSLSA